MAKLDGFLATTSKKYQLVCTFPLGLFCLKSVHVCITCLYLKELIRIYVYMYTKHTVDL